MIGQDRIFELLRRALESSPADATEVGYIGVDEQLTRFAGNTIHQNVAEDNHALTLRLVVDGRIGTSTTNDVTAEGLAWAIRAAMAAARLSPPASDFPGLPGPVQVEPVAAYDDETAAYTPEQRAEQVAQLCRGAEQAGAVAAGALRTASYEYAIANSQGLAVYHPRTGTDFTTVVMTDTSAGYADGAAWRVAGVDVAGLGEAALQKALRCQDPQPLEAGVYPVVLEPYAVADIVEFLSLHAGAKFAAEGRSWINGRQSQQLMSPLISIWDDGRDPAGWPLPFDFEGMPRRRVDIVKAGIAGDVPSDRQWAARSSYPATGHALPAANPYSSWLNSASYGPVPINTFMAPGTASVEEMVAGTERGLYVTRFNYTRVVHPREMVVTGLTRDGTFLIEDGRITRPVRNLRFTQSYVEALAGTEAVGAAYQAMRVNDLFHVVPALKLAAFNFTGTTQF